MVGDDEVSTFTDTRLRNAKIITLFLAIAVLGALLESMAKRPNSLVDIYMGIVAAFIAWLLVGVVRAFRIGLYLDADGVTARSLYATKSWRWGELSSMRTVDQVARGGPMGIGMSRLGRFSEPPNYNVIAVVTTTAGRTFSLRGLKITIASTSSANWLDDAVNEINRRIAARRGPDGWGATPS